MQLAVLDTEFSPDVLSRKLTVAGFSARVSLTSSAKILVSAPSSIVQLSEVVTEYVLSDWISAYILQRLVKEHPYLSDDDREYVRLLATHQFRSESTSSLAERLHSWRIKIKDAVYQVLDRSGTVHIRGVLRFRVNDFLRSVDYVITDVVEHFLVDKEYEEFVSMLRVMLDGQPPSTQTLHVYCTNERVWICDESGSLVRDGEIASAAEQASDNGTVDAEDLAISILIMRSPCAITIHDLAENAPWPSFAETVERVFQQRVSRCQACSTCERLRRTL